MRLRDFLIGWRLLLKEPAYSVVVVLGLSVGVAVCYLLLGFVRYSLSYDEHIPARENIYLVNVLFNKQAVGVVWREQSPLALVSVAERSGLGLTVSGYVDQRSSVSVNNVVHDLDMHIVHPGFQQIFDLKPVAGDLNLALSRPDAIALTLETARKLFGREDVLGAVVQIAGVAFQVAAVLPDPPSNTTVAFHALVGFNSNVIEYKRRSGLLTRWGSLGGKIYLKVPEGVHPAVITEMLQKATDNSPLRDSFSAAQLAGLGKRKLMEIRLCALPDAYFQSDLRIDKDPHLHGDRTTVFGLAGISILVLLLAVTNFVNLTTIRTLRRQREVAMRKVLGAGIGRVVGQFLAESVLVALLATLLGVCLAWALSLPFSHLLNRTLDGLFSPGNLLASVIGGTAVGVLAGAYPTWVALKVRVAQALSGRGNTESASGLWLRRVLTVLQFSTAMGLTAVCIAIAWQTDFASKLNPGFDPDSLLHIDLPANRRSDTAPAIAFRDGLLRIPGVLGVAGAFEVVGRHETTLSNGMSRPGGQVVDMALKGVSPEFFEVYGITPIAGRVYGSKIENNKSESVVINADAARALGFASSEAAVGGYITDSVDAPPSRIIGVATEVRHKPLRQLPESVIYFIKKDLRVFSVRFNADAQLVEQAVQTLWQQHFPKDVLHMDSAQSFFDRDYADDLRVAKMLAASTVIVMLISAFGIYVLAAYSVRRRMREIVLRKLFGAPRSAIAMMIGREFLILIMVSAVIGLSLAALVIERYMAGFVERAPVGGWPLLASFLLACLVALVSTLRHTVSAMTITPSVVLREG